MRWRLTVGQEQGMELLLQELQAHLAEWPNAAILSEDLRCLLDETRPTMQCLVVWQDLATRDVEVWTAPMTADEVSLLSKTNGVQLESDDPVIEQLQDVRSAKGRRLRSHVQGMYLVAKVEVR